MARLQEKYSKEVAPALMEKYSYKSVMQIPKLEKIVINIGCGEGQRKGVRRRSQRPGPDYRPEAYYYKGKKICGFL